MDKLKRDGELKSRLNKLEVGYLLPVAFIAAYADFRGAQCSATLLWLSIQLYLRVFY